MSLFKNHMFKKPLKQVAVENSTTQNRCGKNRVRWC